MWFVCGQQALVCSHKTTCFFTCFESAQCSSRNCSCQSKCSIFPTRQPYLARVSAIVVYCESTTSQNFAQPDLRATKDQSFTTTSPDCDETTTRCLWVKKHKRVSYLDHPDVVFPAVGLDEREVDVQRDVIGHVLGEDAQHDTVRVPERRQSGIHVIWRFESLAARPKERKPRPRMTIPNCDKLDQRDGESTGVFMSTGVLKVLVARAKRPRFVLTTVRVLVMMCHPMTWTHCMGLDKASQSSSYVDLENVVLTFLAFCWTRTLRRSVGHRAGPG